MRLPSTFQSNYVVVPCSLESNVTDVVGHSVVSGLDGDGKLRLIERSNKVAINLIIKKALTTSWFMRIF